MLGSLAGRTRWRWSFWGKHPAVGDFIDHGLTTQIEKALAAWIENGYGRLAINQGEPCQLCAWRFWVQGDGNNRIACGTITSSSDRLGRPFPLLILGSGKLNEWKRHWTELPTTLERIWRSMEALTASRADNYEQLRQMLGDLKPPEANWSREFKKNHGDDLPETDRLYVNNIASSDVTTDHDFQVLSLGDKPLEEAIIWHHSQRNRSENIPKALFMGGAADIPHLVVFYRTLTTLDFERLWLLDRSEQHLRKPDNG